MAEATVSEKYQFVIPKEVREDAGIKVGERLVIWVRNGIISLVPKHNLKAMRGFLKGMDISNYRDEKDR